MVERSQFKLYNRRLDIWIKHIIHFFRRSLNFPKYKKEDQTHFALSYIEDGKFIPKFKDGIKINIHRELEGICFPSRKLLQENISVRT